MKFPEEAKLSIEAKDLICKLLCNVEQRLGTRGADEIKVLFIASNMPFKMIFSSKLLIYPCNCLLGSPVVQRHSMG